CARRSRPARTIRSGPAEGNEQLPSLLTSNAREILLARGVVREPRPSTFLYHVYAWEWCGDKGSPLRHGGTEEGSSGARIRTTGSRCTRYAEQRKVRGLDAILPHYERHWGKRYSPQKLTGGPVQDLGPDFRVLEFPPGPSRAMWTYTTVGMSRV